MNPLAYSDFFNFSDASEVSKFLASLKEMQAELGQLQKAAVATNRQAAQSIKQMAAEAEAASKRVAAANQAELRELTAKAEALRRSNKEAKETKATAEEQANTLGALRKELSRLQREYDVTANNAAKMEAEIKRTNTAIKQNEQAIRAAKTEQTTANQIDIKALQSYNEKSRALNALRARYRELNPQIAAQRVEMEKLLVKIRLLDGQLKNTDKSLGNFQRNVGNYRSAMAGFVGQLPGASQFAPFLQGAGGAAVAAGLAAAAIAGIVAGVSKAEAALLRFKRFENGLAAVSGSATATKLNIRFLYEEADRLGLEVESLEGSFKAFMAASKGTSIEGERARAVFSSVSAAAAKLGIGSEATKRALKALGDMMSKGTVSSEELKQQLGDALPGAFGLMAKALGVTTKELGKMLEQGKVLAEDALPKLAKVLEEQFGSAYINSLEASKNRLTNATDAFWTAIGKRIEPALQVWYDGVADWTKRVTALLSTTEEEVEGQLPQLMQRFRDKNKAEIQEIAAKAKAQAEEYAKILADAETADRGGGQDQGGTFEERAGRRIRQLFGRGQDTEAIKRFKLVAEAEVNAAKEAIRQIELAEEQARTKAKEENKKAADQAAAKRREEAERRRKEAEALAKKLDEYLRSIEEEAVIKLRVRLDEKDEKALLESLKAKPDRPLQILDREMAPEETTPAFSVFNLSSGNLETTDNFLEFQRQVIDNNQFIAAGFAGVGRQLEEVFGRNPFTEFLQKGVAAYQAFLRVQELGIGLRQRDIALTQAQTAAQVKQGAVQAAGAVSKAASQTGIGALVAVPAVLALLASAVGIARSLFKFEEGTEFVPKQRPSDRLGKDSVFSLLAPGERVVPTPLNRELAGISNEDLVRFAKLGMLQGHGLKSVGASVAVAPVTALDEKKLAGALAGEIAKLPVSVNVWDETGYHQRTAALSRAAQIRKKWFG